MVPTLNKLIELFIKNTRGEIHDFFRNRITSYNVCYTKLLRVMTYLEARGYSCEVIMTAYEFQKGGDEMLVVKKL